MPGLRHLQSTIPVLAFLSLPLLPACAHPQVHLSPSALRDGCRSTSIQWFGPGDTRNRASLDRWCAGVGAPFISSVATAEAAALDEIVFVSWNVHVGNGDVDRFVADLRSGRLTDGRVPRHVVLLLQEATRANNVPPLDSSAEGAHRISARAVASSAIEALSTRLEMSAVYVPSMRNGDNDDDPPADRGNAILSTLALGNPSAVELPFERQRRVALFAELELSNGQTMSVGVVHLDALGSARRLWLFDAPSLRRSQAEALRTVLPEGPLVLGADLNTWLGPDEEAARTLREVSDNATAPDHPRADRRSTLDYLFFRTGQALVGHVQTVPDKYGSDHRPIVGWLE